MHFDLRKPCANCPFTKAAGPFLSEERTREIVNAVLHDNLAFACHKHLKGEYDEDDNTGDEVYRPSTSDQHCAGALALITKTNSANAMVQIAERFGLLDPTRLLPEALEAVYDSGEDMICGHQIG